MKRVIVLSVCSATVISCAAGCEHGSDAIAAVSTNVASQPAYVERVVCGRPQRKDIVRTSVLPGRIEAFEETPLVAKVAGYVDAVKVDIGDAVKKGQLLVSLRIPELRDEVNQNKALVAQSEAELKQALASVAAAEAAHETFQAHIAEAKARVDRAAAELSRWSAEHARIEQLAANGSITKKLVDETKSQLQAAEASRGESAAAANSAEAEARQAKALIEKAKADVATAEARIAVAKANFSHAQTMLSYTEISAPFDGVITRRSVDTGHFVQPAGGTTTKPLLTVSRTDKLRVVVDVPELEAGMVGVGDEVDVQIQALPNTEQLGTVSRSSWSVDSINRALRTEIDINNEEGVLRPGLYANCVIQLEKREDALVLPATAIIPEGREFRCCCVEDGKIVSRAVELGIRSGPDVEVTEGITKDASVVLLRPESLQEGQLVQIVDSSLKH